MRQRVGRYTDITLSPSSSPLAVGSPHLFVVISCSLMAFELQRPHIDALQTQLYRTAREGENGYTKLHVALQVVVQQLVQPNTITLGWG